VEQTVQKIRKDTLLSEAEFGGDIQFRPSVVYAFVFLPLA
jgi:hypothetical protein